MKKKIDAKTIRNFVTEQTDPRLSTILYLATQKEKDIITDIVERIKKREK